MGKPRISSLMGSGALIVSIMAKTDFAAAFHVQPAPAAADPISLYDGELEFDVLRNGLYAVTHRVNFSRWKDGVAVKTLSDMKIKVLYFDAYDRMYRSDAIWGWSITARRPASRRIEKDRG